jgi:basic amino acid/polyamine antiporter, APA family
VPTLQRLVGSATALLIGIGVAVGSGIFRTPGQIAAELGSPLWIGAAWIFGGVFVVAAGLVTSELATRFPQAGGEYVYLREAYGNFCAFFFGWGYSVFILGGGTAIIASALGEATCELLAIDIGHSNLIGAAAVLSVTAVNAIGLKAGAGAQNVVTLLKVSALVAVAAIALWLGEAPIAWTAPMQLSENRTSTWVAFVAALPPVLWAYDGSTDAAKMAEEMRDVRRDLPRALIGSGLALTALYVLVNFAFLRVMTPADMAGSRFVSTDVMRWLFGKVGGTVMTWMNVVLFAGALLSTMLAAVRVPFALARDGFAPAAIGRMSSRQSPVAALFAVGTIAAIFTAFRGFTEILSIYFLASAILFGLDYAALIVFRIRDARARRPFPDHAFRCPAGPGLALFLIGVQIAMGSLIIVESPTDSLYTLLLLAAFGAFYWVWKRRL